MNSGLFGMKPYEDTSKLQLVGLPRYRNYFLNKGLFGFPMSYMNNIVLNQAPMSVFPSGMRLTAMRYMLDYGDGTIIDFTGSSIPQYIYPDGLKKTRTITITVFEPFKLQLIDYNNRNNQGDTNCPIHFSLFPNLTYVNVKQSMWNDLNDELYTLTKLAILAYGYQPALYRRLPLDKIKDMPLVEFSPQQSELGLVPFDQSGMDKIASHFPLLQKIVLFGNQLNDNTGGTDRGLPDNFDQLTSLTVLDISSNYYTKIPSVVGRMPQLKELYIGCQWSNTNKNLRDISVLSTGEFGNLAKLGLEYSPLLSPDTPSGFSKLTKLKLLIRTSPSSQSYVDILITSFYDFIVINAAITGPSTLPFRGISYMVDAYYSVVYQPSGLYQKPIGYIQGSSNGYPESPLEMAWVLVNQYSHNVTWSTNQTKIQSITRSGSIVTVITSTPHCLRDNFRMIITGADQNDYNVDRNGGVVIVDLYTLWFTISTTPVSPATGSNITIQTAYAH